MALALSTTQSTPFSNSQLSIRRPPLTRASQAYAAEMESLAASANRQEQGAGSAPGLGLAGRGMPGVARTVASALFDVRKAQVALASASNARAASGEIEHKLRRMRELAIRTSATSGPSARSAMADEFNDLQAEVNAIGERASIGGKSLLSAINGTRDPSSSASVRISGTGFFEGREFVEDSRLLSESAVASQSGITAIEVSDKDETSRYISVDESDGRIIAERSDISEDGTAERYASQTLDASKLQGGIAPGQAATLDFEALGFKTTLDDRFRLGNLDNKMIQTDRLTGEESGPSGGAGFALDISQQSSALDAANALDAALVRLGSFDRDVGLFQEKQRLAVRKAFSTFGGSAGSGRINIIG